MFIESLHNSEPKVIISGFHTDHTINDLLAAILKASYVYYSSTWVIWIKVDSKLNMKASLLQKNLIERLNYAYKECHLRYFG